MREIYLAYVFFNIVLQSFDIYISFYIIPVRSTLSSPSLQDVL